MRVKEQWQALQPMELGSTCKMSPFGASLSSVKETF